MKIKAGIFFAITLLFGCICSSAQSSAPEYYEQINSRFTELRKQTWAYTNAATHYRSTSKIERRRKQMIRSCEMALRHINSMPTFNGDSRFRDSCLSFLIVNYAVISEDYSALVNMEQISDNSYDAMEAYIMAKENAVERLRVAAKTIGNEFSLFEEKYGITPVTSDGSLEKLSVSEKVYNHYNAIYTIFFECYKQEAYLLEAMRTDDISAIEQNRKALLSLSTAGLKQLSELPGFKEDKSMLDACGDMLTFYQNEAGEKLKRIAEYYVSIENFTRIYRSYNAKPITERHSEFTEVYRRAETEYKFTNYKIMVVNAELDEKRKSLLNIWHKSCDRYLTRHIPR